MGHPQGMRRLAWILLAVTVIAAFVLAAIAPALAAGNDGAADSPAAPQAGGDKDAGGKASDKAVVVLGADLTSSQRETVLKLLGVDDPSTLQQEPLILTHEEEVALVGDYVPKEQLGSRAISSVRVEPGEPGSGIRVETRHITWVPPEMYAEALATAGVEDAVVYVAAPFDVSGTAALAGIYKAYEISAGERLSEERKDLGAHEIGVMVKVAKEIGDPKKASEFLSLLKQRMAEHPPSNRQEILDLIRQLERDLGIQLSDALREELATLVEKLRDANIDWQAVKSQLQDIRERVNRFLGEDTPILRRFFNQVWDFILQIVDAVKSWFGQ
ncbi:MAG: DUF1002 domain-containing protein [Bacillota bacterium]|nr:MAG: DUF1002 domain-containing protein [Bacillota bacterium]